MGNDKNLDMLEIAKYSIFTDNTRKKEAGMRNRKSSNRGRPAVSQPDQFESLRPLETGAGRKAQIHWTGSKASVESSDLTVFTKSVREQMIIQEIDEDSSDKFNSIVATAIYADSAVGIVTGVEAVLFTVTGATGRFRDVKWVLINYQNGEEKADGSFTNAKNRELHFIKRESDRDSLMERFNGQPKSTFLSYKE